MDKELEIIEQIVDLLSDFDNETNSRILSYVAKKVAKPEINVA